MAGESPETIKIFLSHKKNDAKLAHFIRDRFLFFANDRLEFMMLEEIPAGENWREWIIRAVADAKLLFFLVPSPTMDLSWCMYEVGIFETRNQGPTTKRVVLLCGEAVDIPGPLKPLQAVRAKLDEMKEFLRQFFGTADLTGVEPPISKPFANNDEMLTQTAIDICQEFEKPLEMLRKAKRKPKWHDEKHDEKLVALVQEFEKYWEISRRAERAVKGNDQVFLVMSMDPDKPMLEDVHGTVKAVCSDFGLRCERADDMEHNYRITDRVIESIRSAGLIICDLSGERPNVYYELGYGHAMDKEVIHIASEATTLHFDVKDFNTIFYKNMTGLRKSLEQRLQSMGHSPSNPT